MQEPYLLIFAVVVCFRREVFAFSGATPIPYPGEKESVNCPDGWEYHIGGNHCLKFSQNKMNWQKASSLCKSFNTNLDAQVRMISITDQSAIDGLLDELHTERGIWICFNAFFEFGDLAFQDKITHNCHQIVNERLTKVNCNATALAVCEIANVNPCRKDNGGCSQFCYADGIGKRKCGCKPEFELKMNTECVEKAFCLIANGGCDHICRSGMSFRKCGCRPGYHLVDHVRCKDVDECLTENGGCEHNCTNLPGSWNCSCVEGLYTKEGAFCRYKGKRRSTITSGGENGVPVSVPVLSGFFTIIVFTFGGFMALFEYELLIMARGQYETEVRIRESREDQWDKEVNVDESEVRDISTIDELDLQSETDV